MQLRWKILALLLVVCWTHLATAQSKKQKQLKGTERTEFELNNYYLFLNINAMLNSYSTKIEYQLDSVMAQTKSPDLRNRQLFLKSALITSVSQTAFHPDPLAAALDSWVMCYQFMDYFGSAECVDEYGAACPVMQSLFRDYASRYENGLEDFMGEEEISGIKAFSSQYPIMDSYLTRRSIIYELSDWISSEELRLKTGLISMNELMRDVGSKIEYYAAMLPKQTMWEMDRRMGEFIQPDSLAAVIQTMNRTLKASADLLERSEALLEYNRDTILANVDYQRRLTMAAIRRERIEAMQSLSAEREAVLSALREERIEAQQFISEQQELLSKDMTGITGNALSQSEELGKSLVDYVFYRLLILTAVLAVFVAGGIWFVKKI